MTDLDIEKILRNPPRVEAPEGLAAEVRSDIRLPVSAATTDVIYVPLWRRWMPAFSFAFLALGCLMVLGVQTKQLVQLKRSNDTLRGEISRKEAAPRVATMNEASEAETAPKRAEELQSLRTEVKQLRSALEELPKLRAQNKALHSQMEAKTAAEKAEDPFADLKAEADKTQCVSNMKQIGLAGRMWANDNGEVLPPALVSMQNELPSPKTLICPADKAKLPPPTTWQQFAGSSYEFLAPGVSTEQSPDVIVTRCLIHRNHFGTIDGAVQRAEPPWGPILEGGLLRLK